MARKIDIEHLNTYTAYLAEKIYKLFVQKVFGKGLSENDYTNAEKKKLSGIAEGANKTVTDVSLSSTSANPIQNKAVKAEADRLQQELDTKVPSSRTVNGHALSANITLTASDVGADASGASAGALSSAKSYTDQKIAGLIGGAPETLDTLKEVADAISANENVVKALDAAIGTKAGADALNTHVNNKSNPHNVTKAQIGLGKVPDVETNDQTPTFTQATTRANIASGEKLTVIFGKIMKWFADLKTVAFSGNYNDLSNRPGIPAAVAVKGNAESSYRTGNVNLTPGNLGAAVANHSHSNATQSAAGLMSAADKKKLDGVASGANAYSLPLATASVRGGAKIGYTANGKNYPVQLSNEQMYVNVPWTDTNTTYGVATQSANGLMTAADKKKLDGIVLEEAAETDIDKIIAGTYT